MLDFAKEQGTEELTITCRQCRFESSDLTRFIPDKRKKHGVDRYCKDCNNKRVKEIYHSTGYDKQAQFQKNKERHRKKKVKSIEYLGGRCIHCDVAYDGANAPIFDFHHVDPKEKELPPATALAYSWERLKTELDKCILLCSNCHRIHHHEGY